METNHTQLTRRELIQQSGLAASSLLLPHSAEALRARNAEEAVLPPGVTAQWDSKSAAAEATPTRSRICINGLWRWQPAPQQADTVPHDRWGYFKVPGPWPGITDYLQKDCQTIYPHPDWHGARIADVTAAWYEREITIPADWAGRHIGLCVEYLNSLATVYLDGKAVGELQFPGGEIDLTAACRPGETHLLSLLVTAAPLQAVMLSYTDTAAARQVKGTVANRGLCGDVHLVSLPTMAHITDVQVQTSVRSGEIRFDAALEGLSAEIHYALHAVVREGTRTVREFRGSPFQASELKSGRATWRGKWLPDRLWDLHTPQHTFSVEVRLVEADGRLLDTYWPMRVGFREFYIVGRDFHLNGSRIFLSAVPLDSARVGAARASYEGARETLERLKAIGINFVYTHNYGCEPGSHLSFAEILRAADDVGMLVAFSQPHFSHYDWRAPEADRDNGYARHSQFYVRAAQNHPSVVAYAMSHNATSAIEDINPDLIDGTRDLRETWGRNNEHLALRAEAIVKRFDPNRIVYHHSSGNLGSMFTANFYVNFVPEQELSDWFEHWATHGVKPAFLCEYGSPISWDWTMYRGWYDGKREWGSAAAPWEFCLAEWDAQFLGDPAYRIGDREKANLRWEAAQFRAGKLWHRWDYPTFVGSSATTEWNPIIADYITANWRAFRTWGLSAFNAWEYEMYWRLRDGVDRRRKALPVDWSRLQRPGFSADYLDERPDSMALAFDRADWVPSPAGQALLRNNGPLLAYIAGKSTGFTGKEHHFLPGETAEKQLIVINNSRRTVTCDCEWRINLPGPLAGNQRLEVPTGEQERIPLRFTLPVGLAAGRYEMVASVRFSTGETQRDTFAIDVLPRPRPATVEAKLALYDPHGETARQLGAIGVRFQAVEAAADLSRYELLIIGKGALTREGPAPDIRRVRDGLKVIVLEQTAEALEQRLGFRVAEYGLRQVFRRLADHPALAGLSEANLHDWNGAATLSTPRLKYTVGPRYSPSVTWCGIDVTRVWRCGCRGNVASVLIEKPARGDFMPIVDGGYSLQYSPLLEYREGKGMALFCQMDVTGRTEGDPAADHLLSNLLRYAARWKPGPRRKAYYVGAAEGRAHLKAAGIRFEAYSGGKLPSDGVLIVGGGGQPTGGTQEVPAWLRAGGHLLAIGLNETEANALLPNPVRMSRAEHISSTFDLPTATSWLAGVGPADLHNRDPRELPLLTGGAEIPGNGVLASALHNRVVFSQLAPWAYAPHQQMNLKRTFRRVSCLTTRLAANLGVACSTPLLDRFGAGCNPAAKEQRWLDGLYLDTPEEWDDPYRFFGW